MVQIRVEYQTLQSSMVKMGVNVTLTVPILLQQMRLSILKVMPEVKIFENFANDQRRNEIQKQNEPLNARFFKFVI